MEHLILLHGALGHPDVFGWYAEQLAPFFHIHTPIFAGHGGTALPAGPLTIATYVTQLQQYCEDKELKRVHIFGYSMGGYVALAYAAAVPGNVAAVMTLATKFDWTPETAAKEVAMLQPDIIVQKVPKFADALAALHGVAGWKILMTAVGGMLLRLGQGSLLTGTVMAAMETRVQLMVGDKDMMVTVQETVEAAGLIPGAALAVVPATAHPFEKADRELLLLLMKHFFNAGKA